VLAFGDYRSCRMLEKPIITLTTDFGLKDPFVGLIKGVILGINPNAKIIDITHNIQRHNIYEAMQVLNMSYKYFPSTTIHMVVVDPGVGSNRRPLLVATDDYYFIGPDNGVFSPIYEDSKSGILRVIHITASHYFLPMSGSTFHGRDIFAPVAAWLSTGRNCEKFGEEISDYFSIFVPRPELHDDSISGEVVSIDNFGNVITNITMEHLSGIGGIEGVVVKSGDMAVPVVNYYAEGKENQLYALVNSFGHLELFVNKDNAAEKFGINTGHTVSVLRK
jgi:hypothetical protein